MNCLFTLLVLPALVAVVPVSVQADSFNIAAGDVAGLKAAITAANTNGQDNVINLAPATYTLTSVDNITNGPTGLPVIGSDSGHSITIYGHYATITRSSSAPFRILQTAANSNVVLDEVIIRHGLIADFYGPATPSAVESIMPARSP